MFAKSFQTLTKNNGLILVQQYQHLFRGWYDFYESPVHSKFDDQDSWGLKSIAYNAPIISISDPKQAVKDLASYSRQYRDDLDALIKIDPDTGTPYIMPEDMDQVKQITQDLVRKTAGYVKGLIEYYNENAYSTPLGVNK